MPRRIPDYPDVFAFWNYVVSFGSVISVVGAILFFYILFLAFSPQHTQKFLNFVKKVRLW